MRTEGFEHAAKLVRIISESPHKASEILKRYKDDTLPPKKLSPDEGVSMIIEADLSRAQYSLVKSIAKQHHADIFPSHHDVLDAKKNSYPPSDKVTINEKGAEVNLHALLNFDAHRLVATLKNSQQGDQLNTTTEYEMLHKWGSDGSGGHSLYKQIFSDESSSDGSMLLTTIVPLQLRVLNGSEIMWTNPAPASTRFCKPLRIQFVKECKESLVEEEKHFKSQIEMLEPTLFSVNDGYSIKVYHKLTMTMIDGKARNMMTETSSMGTCCACGATPSKMAVTSAIQRQVDMSVYAYGISVLHSRIRFLECLLHVAYKMEIKKWSAKHEDYRERKHMIQEQLCRELGILVDTVNQGSGSTNDGNTARRFFELAEITGLHIVSHRFLHQIASINLMYFGVIAGLNKELIERFSVILNALACGFAIDPPSFKKYALKTAFLFEKLYPWYYMPASLHYVLIHGADIIASMDLPIGLYSEDALEARNKNVRSFREHRTRKISREATKCDLFYRLWITGDIFFSSLRKYDPKEQESIPDSIKMQ